MGAAPYTLDLRERIAAAFRSDMSRLEIATLFQVSESSVQRSATVVAAEPGEG